MPNKLSPAERAEVLASLSATASWTFPWPTGVTVNSLYEHSRAYRSRRTGKWVDGGRHLGAKANAWRDEVIVIVRQNRQPLPDGNWALILLAYPPKDGRPHDVDNLGKFTRDSICIALDVDDARITQYHAMSRPLPTGETPRIEVELILEVTDA